MIENILTRVNYIILLYDGLKAKLMSIYTSNLS